MTEELTYETVMKQRTWEVTAEVTLSIEAPDEERARWQAEMWLIDLPGNSSISEITPVEED